MCVCVCVCVGVSTIAFSFHNHNVTVCLCKRVKKRISNSRYHASEKKEEKKGEGNKTAVNHWMYYLNVCVRVENKRRYETNKETVHDDVLYRF